MSEHTVDQKALAPCPFCGGEAKLVASRIAEDAMATWVACTSCGATSPETDDAYRNNAAAADIWNRRALPEAGEVAGLVAELRGKVGSEFDDEAHLSGAEVEQIAAALTRQSADIARLEKERDDQRDLARQAVEKHGHCIRRSNELLDRAEAAEAQLADLKAEAARVLEPFAKLHDEIVEATDKFDPPYNDPENWAKGCQWPDLVAARALHSKVKS